MQNFTLKIFTCTALVLLTMASSHTVASEKKSKAKSRAPSSDTGVQVIVEGGEDASVFDNAGYHVYQRDRKVKDRHDLPRSDTRNQIFAESGITPADTNGMDALEMDFLYLRALNYKLDVLEQKYPNIEKDKLRALKQRVDARAAAIRATE